MNYYNEWDSFAADWLRELIKDGLIPDGEVDNRSIADVRPEDLKEFTQCHFFAGIGGWSRALQLAGWSSDRPVWTGSPPCQSFSTAGKGKGKDDERHLWPVFFNLIRECQPPTVFGEQVAAAIRYGWLDDLQIDFEKEGYAAGAFVLPAGGIGAPHKRERLFFVADSQSKGGDRGLRPIYQENEEQQTRKEQRQNGTCKRIDGGSTNFLANSNVSSRRPEQEPEQQARDQWRQPDGDSSIASSVADSNNERHERSSQARRKARSGFEHTSSDSMANSGGPGWEGCIRPRSTGEERESERYSSERSSDSSVGNSEHDGSHETEVGRSTGSGEAEGGMLESKGSDSLFWGSSEVIYCRDGKYRPISTEPALFPLADGIPNRVGILRGAGNAIVPQAAAEIIKAYLS